MFSPSVLASAPMPAASLPGPGLVAVGLLLVLLVDLLLGLAYVTELLRGIRRSQCLMERWLVVCDIRMLGRMLRASLGITLVLFVSGFGWVLIHDNASIPWGGVVLWAVLFLVISSLLFQCSLLDRYGSQVLDGFVEACRDMGDVYLQDHQPEASSLAEVHADDLLRDCRIDHTLGEDLFHCLLLLAPLGPQGYAPSKADIESLLHRAPDELSPSQQALLIPRVRASFDFIRSSDALTPQSWRTWKNTNPTDANPASR